MTTQKQAASEAQVVHMKNSKMINNVDQKEEKDEDQTANSALEAFHAKEEEIERRKSDLRDKVEAQLGRVEEETKRLVGIRGELEALTDPMRKEAATLCKRIDLVTKDLKQLGVNWQKKEKEYKEAQEAFNEKNKEKGQLIGKLVELVTESEKVRFKKLEELCKNLS